ncbi:MAG TPA: type III-A CRISPR-associated RAMP protein Csm3 [Dongiaceae bacterium]|nr:type III-A CRISPR-associated RAMP protein Csm3 [Dongiaceae bacterium]
MRLTRIADIKATLELLTGLHIGAGELEMRIGGVDNTVVKHPITQQPYIPGSSLKGRIRSLLEWRSGAVQEKPLGFKDMERAAGAQRAEVERILMLFGLSGGDSLDESEARRIGPTRVSLHDAPLAEDFVKEIVGSNLPLTEIKSENSINRISGTALNPRQTERVPAGARFSFRATLRVFEGDPELMPVLLQGLRLLELDSLGGSGSRGYGKLRFAGITCDGSSIESQFRALDPFPVPA